MQHQRIQVQNNNSNNALGNKHSYALPKFYTFEMTIEKNDFRNKRPWNKLWVQ
jgi:hypothetical protein